MNKNENRPAADKMPGKTPGVHIPSVGCKTVTQWGVKGVDKETGLATRHCDPIQKVDFNKDESQNVWWAWNDELWWQLYKDENIDNYDRVEECESPNGFISRKCLIKNKFPEESGWGRLWLRPDTEEFGNTMTFLFFT